MSSAKVGIKAPGSSSVNFQRAALQMRGKTVSLGGVSTGERKQIPSWHIPLV